MNRIELILMLFLLSSAATADSSVLPIPPLLGFETDPEPTLQAYPLGVITELAAFARHGAPKKKMTLANGKQGWVYEVGYSKTRKTYKLPSGKPRSVSETEWGLGVRSYTLVFDDGVVIDVIYKDDSDGIGVTAMEMQQPRPSRGPGS